MFHGSYHFVQELYFTRYLFCAFCICHVVETMCTSSLQKRRKKVCICHVVETMCTSSLQKRRKKVLASNSQPAPAGDNYL